MPNTINLLLVVACNLILIGCNIGGSSSSGILTAIGTGTPVATGTNPGGISISPDRTNVYVINTGSNIVLQYSRN